jgi:nicotinate-nucleotide pyrophosphorylase (carboxylating)
VIRAVPSSVRGADEPGLLARALREDRADRDRTTRALFDRAAPARATVLAEAAGVASGVATALAWARRKGLRARAHVIDGDALRPGTRVLTLAGDARHILALERTLLNLLMHLSGVATRTRETVRRAQRARRGFEVLATRKTLPGLRALEKAAVVHGGGKPHRRDLADAVLVKNNHLAFFPLDTAVRRLRDRLGPRERLQVEVRSLAQARAAIAAGADALLLDNMSPGRARAILRALGDARPRPYVELSGGIRPETVARYARTGADGASLGALTHSAPALPMHLRLTPAARTRRRPR